MIAIIRRWTARTGTWSALYCYHLDSIIDYHHNQIVRNIITGDVEVLLTRMTLMMMINQALDRKDGDLVSLIYEEEDGIHDDD